MSPAPAAKLTAIQKYLLLAIVAGGILAVNYRVIFPEVIVDSGDPKWVEGFEADVKLPPGAKLAEHLSVADEMSRAVEKEEFEKLNAFFDHALQDDKTIESGIAYFNAVLEHIALPAKVERSLNKWVDKYPESAGARILRSSMLLGKAWDARGFAFASEVTNEQWKAFYDLLIKSREDIEAALKIYPENRYLLSMLLRLETANGLNDEAKELFARLIQKYPEYAPPYQIMLDRLKPQWGGSVEQMFEFTRRNAGTYPESTLPLDIVTVHSHIQAVSCNNKQGAAAIKCAQDYYSKPEVWTEISGVFERLLKSHPSSIWHTQYGHYAALRGDFALAQKHFQQAAALNPGMPSVYYQPADMYEKQGDFAKALQEHIKLKKLQPTLGVYKSLYYDAYQIGKPKLATYYLQQAMTLDPDDTFVLRNLCRDRIAENALAACDGLVAKFPDSAEFHVLKGSLLSSQGKEDEAFEAFDKAVLANPTYFWGYLNRCYSHRIKGRLDEALADCNDAVELKANYKTYEQRALVYEAMGDNAKRDADIEKMQEFQDRQ